MTIISVNQLSYAIGTRQILDKISFSLEENDKMGIVGVNGCGKSTLLRCILGEWEPTEGNVYVSSGKSVGILRQDGAFTVDESGGRSALEQMYTAFPELLEDEKLLSQLQRDLEECDAAREPERHARLTASFAAANQRFIAGGGLEFRGRCASLLAKMGYSEEQMRLDITLLSGGQRTRLALARQLCREPDIFLLDEPTNHLDIETLSWLENFLISYKKCIIVISHDRYFLDRVTGKTLAMEYGKAKLYKGGYTATMEQRRIDKELAEKHYRDQQKEIARQEAYIEQQRRWNRERNIIAAESRLKLLAKMEKLEKPREAPKSISFKFNETISSGNEVLEVKGLSMAYGEKKLFSDVKFLVRKDERVYIVGANGCGKSTLLNILLGRIAPTGGNVRFGYNVEIGYYDQENQNLTPGNTVLDELWNAYPRMDEVDVRRALAAFRFTYEDTEKLVSVLSGGEKVRLTLAKLMLAKVNLLILDEPTNHLDIDSREALQEAIRAFDGTVITVSHDRYLIEKTATRVIELVAPAAGGGVYDYTVETVGEGYTEFGKFRAEHEKKEATVTPLKKVPASKEEYLRNKQEIADKRREEARRARLAKEAQDLETRIGEIDAELYGEAATDYQKAAALEEEKTAAEERLLEIYEIIGV